MNEINRTFIFGELELRKFIISDYLYLIAYFISVAYYLYVMEYNSENKLAVSLFVSLAVGFQTISGPFGLRFRNVYFSMIWLLLSSVFVIENYYLGIVPILTFALYHSIRFVFWRKYNREFIPYEVGRGTLYRHSSFFEGRSGNNKDKRYTKILLAIGILIVMFSQIKMIGTQIK